MRPELRPSRVPRSFAAFCAVDARVQMCLQMVRRFERVCVLSVACAMAAWPAAAQQLGPKVLAGVGIDAGTQPMPGLYVINRLVDFTSVEARNRNGDPLPLEGLDISAFGDAVGVAFTVHPGRMPYLNFAASLPVARLSISIDHPLTSIDRFGLSDLFVQPLKLGWRGTRHDIVAGYAFYAPTGRFEPRTDSGVGRGHWTHEFAVGGAAYTSSERRSHASMLATFELNERKRGIDIRRGNMFQMQGGAGVTATSTIVLGVAGYALWQVSDDSGADLPDVLRGARTRVFGLGPEVDVTIPVLRMRAGIRFEWDFGVRARPMGQVLGAGTTYRAWAPTPRTSK
jgi:hypothetical protein